MKRKRGGKRRKRRMDKAMWRIQAWGIVAVNTLRAIGHRNRG